MQTRLGYRYEKGELMCFIPNRVEFQPGRQWHGMTSSPLRPPADPLLQVAVHAIGDLAVDEVAKVFSGALKARRRRAKAEADLYRPADPGAPTRRPMRIEHAQHLSGPDVAVSLSRGR